MRKLTQSRRRNPGRKEIIQNNAVLATYVDDYKNDGIYCLTGKHIIESYKAALEKLMKSFEDKKVKLTKSDNTHLYGYLNPIYRNAVSIPKRNK